MRVIGIETSTERGSVTLLEDEKEVLSAEHEEPNRHAERILSLLTDLLARAGWPKRSIDRVAVGVGPGSFVGLRVGIALGEGLSLGLGCPLLGISSLEAMARAAPGPENAVRIALLDARRGEIFFGAYDKGGTLVSPCALPRAEVAHHIDRLGSDSVVTGRVGIELGLQPARSRTSDLPHALLVATLARDREPSQAPPAPLYVRGSGAAPQNLPSSPFRSG